MVYSARVLIPPHLVFATPRKLPKAASLQGRVVVLDVAFASSVGSSVSFAQVTRPLIDGLGERLAAWVDHHDSEHHASFTHDPRFVLATKQAHGGCPEMITPELVARIGPVDTVVTHVDLDGLYAAAKWLLAGAEPYVGADDDARAIDTRIGVAGARAVRIDSALRARFRDDGLKRAIVRWLASGMGAGEDDDAITAAAAEFEARAVGTAALAARYVLHGRVAVIDATGAALYDKTDLLLAGQTRAPVSMVVDSGNATLAAPFSSGWDFVQLLGLGGGMPTRVSVPVASWEDAIARINAAALPEPSPAQRANGDE